MGRVELRGYDWAGLEWMVEVPEGVSPERDWILPVGFVPRDDVDPERAVRIQVGCAPLSALSAFEGGTAYFHEGDVFETGTVGGDHWIRRADDGRVAVAAPGFASVEVALPMPATDAGFPLAHPLDDIVLLHRALQQGAFALRGCAALRDGAALVVLGDDALNGTDPRSAFWSGWLLLQPSGGGIDVVPLPSTLRSGRTGQAGNRARLAGLHVVDCTGGDGDGVRVLDADAAAGELLRFAFVPMADRDSGEHVLWAASRIAEWAPVVQVEAPGQTAFAWRGPADSPRAALPAGA